jgi:5'-methylthioadenosine phosphorylase
MADPVFGIIGGSGLYEMEGLTDLREEQVTTPFGDPSDAYILGRLDGHAVAFLSRHGRGHRRLPSELNFRANIYGFKMLGVQWIISASAVGSMRDEIRPSDIVVPDQFFDRTRARASTFFGDGVVAHVSFADPVCPDLSELLFNLGRDLGARMHKGGTYLCIEGPQFSTRAESRIYRSWGVDVIGMTNLQEAKLSREAEICYATMALVTDYDVWHEAEGDVTVEKVIAILHKNVATAKDIVRGVIPMIRPERSCGCASALKDAIITAPEAMSEAAKKKLWPFLGKYLGP